MYCPQCKSEYRAGFVKCADCGVELVEHLSQDYSDDDGNVATDSAGRRLIWSGMSRKFLAGFYQALDAAKIEHVQTTKEFGLLPTTMQSATFVWVAPRDFDAARSLLDEMFANPDAEELVADEERAQGRRRLYWRSAKPLGRGALSGLSSLFSANFGDAEEAQEETGDAASEVVVPISDSDDEADSDEPVPDDLIEDFHPDDATAEVWAGDDTVMAENLSMCLRNVGVGCVLGEEHGKSRLRVLPAQEKRAREIVKQVLDAS